MKLHAGMHVQAQTISLSDVIDAGKAHLRRGLIRVNVTVILFEAARRQL